MNARSRKGPRRFGLVVGGVFLALGALSAWRGHVWPPRVLWGLGGALVLPALVWPRLLRPVERGWMAVAEALAWVNTRLILGGVYYAVVTPVGFVRRMLHDPLERRIDRNVPSYWKKRPREPVDPQRYRQQF